jgi:hypothetical protein
VEDNLKVTDRLYDEEPTPVTYRERKGAHAMKSAMLQLLKISPDATMEHPEVECGTFRCYGPSLGDGDVKKS